MIVIIEKDCKVSGGYMYKNNIENKDEIVISQMTKVNLSTTHKDKPIWCDFRLLRKRVWK